MQIFPRYCCGPLGAFVLMTPAVFADTEHSCQSLEPQPLYPLLRDAVDAVLSSASWTQVTAVLCSMGSNE